MHIDKMYDKKGLQKILGVSISTVNEMVRQNKIRYVRVGRLVRFREADVFAYLDKRVCEAINE